MAKFSLFHFNLKDKAIASLQTNNYVSQLQTHKIKVKDVC